MITLPSCEWLVVLKGSMKQEKHNTSYASKAGMVSEVLTNQARPDDQDIKTPM